MFLTFRKSHHHVSRISFIFRLPCHRYSLTYEFMKLQLARMYFGMDKSRPPLGIFPYHSIRIKIYLKIYDLTVYRL